MYEDPARTVPLMESYQADLLYVGPEERDTYVVSEPPGELMVLYRNRDVTIYQRKSSET